MEAERTFYGYNIDIFLMDIYFHKNIKLLRKQRGLTQGDISEALGLTHNSIGRLERGQGFPKVEGLLKMVEIFEVNLHDLVFTDLANEDGKPPRVQREDPEVAMTVLRLNLEIDRMAKEIIQRADPNDLGELERFRAELIRRNPERARALGINLENE